MSQRVGAEAIDALRDVRGASIEEGRALSTMTTYHIGGPVDVVATVDDAHALEGVMSILRDADMPWVMIGGGSNILASDDGYRGCAIRLGKGFSQCSVSGPAMVAGAAMPLAKAVMAACKARLSGLEQCTGIPGTVGGAIAMNAGTHLGSISEAVESVTMWSLDRGLRTYGRGELGWGYRQGPVGAGDIVLEATFALSPAPSGTIAVRMDECQSYRARTQPIGRPTCGSVFRNPPEGPVAKMLDERGLRGCRIGGASVSRRHANFVVNEGNAHATDVLELMRLMRHEVRDGFGVDIRPEVRLVGFDEGTLAEYGLGGVGDPLRRTPSPSDPPGSRP